MRIPSSMAGRIALIVAAAVALLLVASQLLLPGIGERAIEDRLTENGGVAEASLEAVPAARLLWGDGDRLAVQGIGLDLDLEAEEQVFDDLDRFGDVQIAISDSNVGPFRVDSFVLTRDGAAPYELVSRGSSSGSDLAQFGAQRLELPGAGLLGAFLDLSVVGGQHVPINLDMEFASEDGRIVVTDGGGTIAGIPAGPLAELITAAIVVRL